MDFSSVANEIVRKYRVPEVDCNDIPDSIDRVVKRPTAQDYDYREKWGLWEGIREIIQNSMDVDARIDIYSYQDNILVIHDDGPGFELDAYKYGGGTKAGKVDTTYHKYCRPTDIIKEDGTVERVKLTRGEFGEGMKFALLVFAKEKRIHGFYHYNRCLRVTAKFDKSDLFTTEELYIIYEPVQYHSGVTLVIFAEQDLIDEIKYLCETRFIYDKLYVDGKKIEKDVVEVFDQYYSIGEGTITTKIGNIVNIDDESEGKKSIYVKGIYVTDEDMLFSYDLICPKLGSDRNMFDISQFRDQIQRIFYGLILYKVSEDGKTLIKQKDKMLKLAKRILYAAKNESEKGYMELNLPQYGEISEDAREIYYKAFIEVFGENAFLSTSDIATMTASQMTYTKKDQNGMVLYTLPYVPVYVSGFIQRVLRESGVTKDIDIVTDEIIDKELTEREQLEFISMNKKQYNNLKDAISLVCSYRSELDIEEEIKKWKIFLYSYKNMDQVVRKVWKEYKELSEVSSKFLVQMRSTLDKKIKLLQNLSTFPEIISGLGIDISLLEKIGEKHDKDKEFDIISDIREKLNLAGNEDITDYLTQDKIDKIIKVHVAIDKINYALTDIYVYDINIDEFISRIERTYSEGYQMIDFNFNTLDKVLTQIDNMIIPLNRRYGWYKHNEEIFGIRLDVLYNRALTFTTVLHEYGHALEHASDVDDYSSDIGRILTFIQFGYGEIVSNMLNRIDEFFNSLKDSGLTVNEIIEEIKASNKKISDVIISIMCK